VPIFRNPDERNGAGRFSVTPCLILRYTLAIPAILVSMSLPAVVGPDAARQTIVAAEQTSCCIVGGGPAGAMLALLLARRDVPVTLLEMHKDFDREFRGDTVHPSTMEILDQIGLAEKLHQIPHTKISGPGGPEVL
jgi:NADPH-dependent 2,4-dienoyl-CoA reductase/sulfur reductase-like enzyme